MSGTCDRPLRLFLAFHRDSRQTYLHHLVELESGMHRALGVFEIISPISQHAITNRDRAALLAICKLFEDPVREILWSSIPHANMLACLILGSKWTAERLEKTSTFDALA
jgi:hypothetical protein